MLNEPKTDWRLKPEGVGKDRADRWRSLPRPLMTTRAMLDPALYVADRGLVDAINAAILLGQPLLVAGEPGCGKTEVGNFVAYNLGLERYDSAGAVTDYALRFDTKSTTTGRDLFYTLDMIGRFHAASAGGTAPDARRFLTFNALGRAILDAADVGSVAHVWGTNYRRNALEPPRRSVILIDEIDKAPRDVPNDLLMETENMRFYIAELDITVTALPEFRPIVVITSNSERSLPDAFLRRCVFYQMQFPGLDQLREIVARRLPRFPSASDFMDDLLSIFLGLRDLQLSKIPGTAEFLAFASALVSADVASSRALRTSTVWCGLARVCLLKSADDQAIATDKFLADFLRR